MDFKKSETYKNLEKAYDGELLAGTKYRIYSRIANKDGFRQIGNIFEETAKNEQEHAEIWLRMMNEGALPMLDEIDPHFHQWKWNPAPYGTWLQYSWSHPRTQRRRKTPPVP